MQIVHCKCKLALELYTGRHYSEIQVKNFQKDSANIDFKSENVKVPKHTFQHQHDFINMITSLKEVLQLPNFGHMTTSTI